MSRSVWRHSDAIETVFLQLDFDEDDLSWGAWDDFKENIRETLKARFPSFEDADSWPERESHCILENGLAKIVISEYCGLVSIGVVPFDGWYQQARIAPAWCEKNIAPVLRKTWGQLRCVGTMSNGESVYKRVAS